MSKTLPEEGDSFKSLVQGGDIVFIIGGSLFSVIFYPVLYSLAFFFFLFGISKT